VGEQKISIYINRVNYWRVVNAIKTVRGGGGQVAQRQVQLGGFHGDRVARDPFTETM
jgi:hypothetical protein